LARKGFHEVNHIGEDSVLRTFYLKPQDDHFDIKGGIYVVQKDAIVKSTEFLANVNKELASKDITKERKAEIEETKRLYEKSQNLKYKVDVVSLRYGMPALYYFGNDINPINFKNREKIYDSKVISAYIKRLLLEKEWKLVRLVLILCICGFFLALIMGFMFVMSVKSNQQNLAMCLGQVNQSSQIIANYLNITLTAASKSGSVII
jgi:hypothetical protein